MNQTNRPWSESQHCKLWFEAKNIWKPDKKTTAEGHVGLNNSFNEGKNYNPMKHWKLHNQINNDGIKDLKNDGLNI